MPCWEVSYASVALKAENHDLLFEGLEQDGNFSYLHRSGQRITGRYNGVAFTIDGGNVTTEEGFEVGTGHAINRAYSARVIKKVTGKYGWALQDQGGGKLVAKKRGV